MHLAEGGHLLVGQRPVRGHDPVAVAVLVPGPECERALDPSARQVLAEDAPPVAQELVEELVEVGVRRPRHGVTVGGDMLRR